MSVRKVIIKAIKTNGLTSFTLDELKVLCCGFVTAVSPDQYSQKLYKNVWNLKHQGFLDLEKQKNSKENRYLTTPLLIAEMSKEMTTETENIQGFSSEFLDALNKRLNDYSTNLATASAEVQEYQELAQEYPEQRVFLDLKYQKAIERATSLRGKLMAIENLLQDQPQ